jgi:hypothetical protein
LRRIHAPQLPFSWHAMHGCIDLLMRIFLATCRRQQQRNIRLNAHRIPSSSAPLSKFHGYHFVDKSQIPTNPVRTIG